jgi:gluconolactonase
VIHLESSQEDFWEVVSPEAELVRLAGDLGFTEGPVWLPAEQCVLFTDIPHNAILRWDERGGLRTWVSNSHFAIGLSLDREGRLLACEHTTRRLTRYEPDGRVSVLASHHGPYVLNSTNDVCLHPDGRIFFTDPPFGVRLDDTGQLVGYQQGMEYGACGVFRVGESPESPLLVTDQIYRPNGLCFSPDGRVLYVSDSSERYHCVYALRLEGDRVLDQQVFAVITPGVPDGMRCDEQGRLYVSALDGVQVFSSEGRLLGKIRVPEMVTNLCFGGPNKQILFITAVSSLYAITLQVKGA